MSTEKMTVLFYWRAEHTMFNTIFHLLSTKDWKKSTQLKSKITFPVINSERKICREQIAKVVSLMQCQWIEDHTVVICNKMIRSYINNNNKRRYDAIKCVRMHVLVHVHVWQTMTDRPTNQLVADVCNPRTPVATMMTMHLCFQPQVLLLLLLLHIISNDDWLCISTSARMHNI